MLLTVVLQRSAMLVLLVTGQTLPSSASQQTKHSQGSVDRRQMRTRTPHDQLLPTANTSDALAHLSKDTLNSCLDARHDERHERHVLKSSSWRGCGHASGSLHLLITVSEGRTESLYGSVRQ